MRLFSHHLGLLDNGDGNLSLGTTLSIEMLATSGFSLGHHDLLSVAHAAAEHPDEGNTTAGGKDANDNDGRCANAIICCVFIALITIEVVIVAEIIIVGFQCKWFNNFKGSLVGVIHA